MPANGIKASAEHPAVPFAVTDVSLLGTRAYGEAQSWTMSAALHRINTFAPVDREVLNTRIPLSEEPLMDFGKDGAYPC